MRSDNNLSKLLRAGFIKKHNFDIKQFKTVISSEEFLDKINHFLIFLDALNAKSVMVLSHPTIDSICMLYALVLSNRPCIIIHPTSSVSLLEKYAADTQADLIIVSQEWKKSQKHIQINDFSSDIFQSFHYYKAILPPTLNLLPGFIFFTTGTTGLPKAMHYQYSVIARYLIWCIQEFPIVNQSIYLFSTELSFIACLRPLFLPLLCDCRVVIADLSSKNKVSHIALKIAEEKITVINVTPSLFRLLMLSFKEETTSSIKEDLKLILLSGETIISEEVNQWRNDLSSSLLFYNLYGATEYLVPFYTKLSKNISTEEANELGSCRHGTDYFLEPLPNNLNRLCISGDMITGYLDHKLTNENFLIVNDKRYIRSSDLVNLKKGRLYFHAREGRVIKRYGNKINLDHVERLLRSNVPVNRSAIVLGGDHRIYLFYEACKTPVLVAKINRLFEEFLPEYMHPDLYIFIDSMPITSSGKIDYNCLSKNIEAQSTTQFYDFFRKFFSEGNIDYNAFIIDLGMKSIDYIELSELILSTTGQWFDITCITDTFKLSDLPSAFSSTNQRNNFSTTKVYLHPIQKLVYSRQINRSEKLAVMYYVFYGCLNKNIDLPRLEKAINETIEANFILSCRLNITEDNYYFERVPVSPNIQLRRRLFKGFTNDKSLITSVHSKKLVNIHIQKRGLRTYLILAYHHLAVDGWSAMNIRNEIFSRYANQPLAKLISQKQEIQYLNDINNPDPAYLKINIKALESLFLTLDYEKHSRFHDLFNNKGDLKKSVFSLSKTSVVAYSKKNKCSQLSYSALFLVNLTLSLFKVTGKTCFYYYVSLSNRYQPTPHIKSLIMNIATALPLFVSLANSSLLALGKEIKDKLDLYFKSMNYPSIKALSENKIIRDNFSKLKKRKYRIIYTYVNHQTNGSLSHDDYIDWDKSYTHSRFSGQGVVFLRVYELSDRFIVTLDSKIKVKMHEQLELEMKEHFNKVKYLNE